MANTLTLMGLKYLSAFHKEVLWCFKSGLLADKDTLGK